MSSFELVHVRECRSKFHECVPVAIDKRIHEYVESNLLWWEQESRMKLRFYRDRSVLFVCSDNAKKVKDEAKCFSNGIQLKLKKMDQGPSLPTRMPLNFAVLDDLPIKEYEKQIFDALDNEVIIINGPTGCGKSTQVIKLCAKYANENGRNRRIVCMQPRRIAATSVASRVASEIGCRMGTYVGYKVRFDDNLGNDTRIEIVTDGILWNYIAGDSICRYDLVIVDEAHQRSQSIDNNLAVLRDRYLKSTPMKLVIMSATMETDQWKDYFSNYKMEIIKIQSERKYRVRVNYLRSFAAEPEKTAAICVAHIVKHRKDGGDILVFLPGVPEIQTTKKYIKRDTDVSDEINVISCHASMSSEKRDEIFATSNKRKCILATNVAESSITVPDVVYVVDTGLCKEKLFVPDARISHFNPNVISRAAATQRAGRCGRTQNGEVFRLYPYETHDARFPELPPIEYETGDITGSVLRLLALGYDNLVTFPFIDAPAPETLMRALEVLYYLGTIDDQCIITERGRMMVRLPVSPQSAAALIAAHEKYDCLDHVASIIAMMEDTRGIWRSDLDDEGTAQQRQTKLQSMIQKFSVGNGDHMMYWNIAVGYANERGDKRAWCKENWIKYDVMKQAELVATQLIQLVPNVSGNRSHQRHSGSITERVLKSFASGYFMQTAVFSKDLFGTVRDNRPVGIHRLSAIRGRVGFSYSSPETLKWVLFQDIVTVYDGSTTISKNSLVPYEWLVEASNQYYRHVTIPGKKVLDKVEKFADRYFSGPGFKQKYINELTFYNAGDLGKEDRPSTILWDTANDDRFRNQLHVWGWNGQSGLGPQRNGIEKPYDYMLFFKSIIGPAYKAQLFILDLDSSDMLHLKSLNKQLEEQLTASTEENEILKKENEALKIRCAITE